MLGGQRRADLPHVHIQGHHGNVPHGQPLLLPQGPGQDEGVRLPGGQAHRRAPGLPGRLIHLRCQRVRHAVVAAGGNHTDAAVAAQQVGAGNKPRGLDDLLDMVDDGVQADAAAGAVVFLQAAQVVAAGGLHRVGDDDAVQHILHAGDFILRAADAGADKLLGLGVDVVQVGVFDGVHHGVAGDENQQHDDHQDADDLLHKAQVGTHRAYLLPPGKQSDESPVPFLSGDRTFVMQWRISCRQAFRPEVAMPSTM